MHANMTQQTCHENRPAPESNASETLRGLKVAEVSHVFATGPAQELEAYLKNRTAHMTFIGHPFRFAGDTRSFERRYNKGIISGEKRSFRWSMPQLMHYFKDLAYTLRWLLATGTRFDLYFGVDVLNAAAGIILKRLGRVKRVVLYTIDYHPHRFGNPILNLIYHRLDSFCLRHCDLVWNLSPLMAEAREKGGMNLDKTARQMVVPLGVNFIRIKRLSLTEIKRHNLAYMGHLRKNQGVELILAAMPQVIRKVPDARLIIIGTGEMEKPLRDTVSKLRLDDYVTFKGYVENHEEVEAILSSCAIGIAPYVLDPTNYTYYADPGKPKQYLACGLPVIITRVPWIAGEIGKAPMGIAINYGRDELTEAIVKLLQDDEFYSRCRENAINFASGLEQTTIFDRALADTIKELY